MPSILRVKYKHVFFLIHVYLNRAVRIKNGFKWMSVIGGICGIIFAGVLFFMKENGVVDVSTSKKPALNGIKA